MTDNDAPDVVVLREGTEGLPTSAYRDELAERLPEFDIRHARTRAEERRLVAETPVVTGVRIDEELLAAAKDLELFACVFSGTDHLPTAALREAGVAVTNASGIHAPGLAEQVVANMLVFARRLHVAWEQSERQEWRHYEATELAGSTVTVVGLGSIGHGVAERLQGFDVETVGVRYTPEKGGPTDEVVGFEDADEAFARADYLVLACPLTETTRNLVDREALRTLPMDAVVVNIARGGIVDTEALVDALQSNDIGGAALDVTDPEPLPPDHGLWHIRNCLITPHVGGSTPKHWERMADILAMNLRRLDDGGDVSELQNLVVDPLE